MGHPAPPPGLGLIDSHAHLDRDLAQGSEDRVLQRAWAAGLGGIVVVAAAGAARVFSDVARLVRREPRTRMVAGIHPHDADRMAELWGPLLDAVSGGTVSAIGETGLDFHYHHSSVAGQRTAFERHLALALERGLPVVLHVREADRAALEILDGLAPRWRGVVHCFTGGPAEAEAWLSRGFHLSIPGVVTFPSRGPLADAVARIPEARILVETDSPYLAPVPLRGRPNEPANVAWTAAEVARIRGASPASLAAATIRNTRNVFGFDVPVDRPVFASEKL